MKRLIGAIFISLYAVTTLQAQAHNPGQTLQKSAETDLAAASGIGAKVITIRLDGLKTGDYINIRPGSQTVTAIAGTLSKTVSMRQGMVSEPIIAGQPLADSTLAVSSIAVRFARPVLLADTVFLDIEIPAKAQVRVMTNSKTILRTSLRHPIALFNGELLEGASRTSSVISRAGLGLAGHHHAVANFREGEFSIIAYSDLQALESPRPNGEPGRTVIVMLRINASGQVIDAVPVSESVPSEIIETLKKWRFVPYIIEGRPTAVSTVVKLVFQ